MATLASYKQQQSIISSVLFILGTLYVTFPLCGCFHYARPACFACCVGFLSLCSLQVNNKTGIIFACDANVNTFRYTLTFTVYCGNMACLYICSKEITCYNKPMLELMINCVVCICPCRNMQLISALFLVFMCQGLGQTGVIHN